MTEIRPEIPTVNPEGEVGPRPGRFLLRMPRSISVGVILLSLAALIVWSYRSGSRSSSPPIVEDPGMHSDIKVAMERARARIAKTPQSGDAWGRYGMLLMQHDRPKEALECFEQAIRFDASDPRWYYYPGVILEQTDLRKALQYLHAGLKLKGDSIPMMLRISAISITLGEFRAAAEILRTIRENSPETAETWIQLVRLERLQAHPCDAAQWLESARRSKSDCAELLRECAVAELQCGNANRSKQLMAEAAGAPQMTPVHDIWMDDLQKLDFTGKVSSSAADQLRANGQMAEAARALESLARRFPERSRPALNFALTLRDQGRLEEAVRAINSLVEEFPEDPLLRFHQAVLNAQSGSPEEAVLQALNEALRLKPDYGTARAGLADILSIQGRYTEALTNYRQAVTDTPADPWIRLGYASVLIAQGQSADAETQLRQVESLLTPQQRTEQQEVQRLRKKLSESPTIDSEVLNAVP